MKNTVNELGLIFKNSRAEKDFTIFYNETVNYYTGVVNYKYKIFGDNASDIISRFYYNIFNGIETFDTKYKFYPWVNTILTNECILFLRNRIKDRLLVSYDDVINIKLLSNVNNVQSDEEHSEQLELIELIYESASKLREPYKTIFNDRYILYKKQAEIVKEYDSTVGTIKNVLSRANRMIQYDILENRKSKKLNRNDFRIQDLIEKINKKNER